MAHGELENDKENWKEWRKEKDAVRKLRKTGHSENVRGKRETRGKGSETQRKDREKKVEAM